MILRPYQVDAVTAAMDFVTKCLDPCLLELATGAGKSLIIADVAKKLLKLSNKKVLCLAPSKELVVQNHGKYLALGEPASIFSASANQKCLKNGVVFGSPVTVNNSIEKFKDNFGTIIIDEAHGITPTIIKIIDGIRAYNPRVRVIGLTATPYRTSSGYIYEIDQNGKSISPEETSEPYFKKLLYSIKTNELIDQGFLTHAIGNIKAGYDTSNVDFRDQSSIEKTFEGQGRKTSYIVSQVVEASHDRMGVMFFAATVQHAHEILESLPQGNSRIVTGNTPAKERELIIKNFKNRDFKYLVNVSVLTTGFDAPHVDLVAILRATESAGLLQQIIGRGLRLHPEKKNVLVMDFAENIERHELIDNLFEPKIKTRGTKKTSGSMEANCESCNTINEFTARPNPDKYEVDLNGYFCDLTGDRVKIELADNRTYYLPAHYGRRCTNQELVNGQHERCTGRWSLKECQQCGAENDIAARYCHECKTELVDPNAKLMLDFQRIKSSARSATSDELLSWNVRKWVSKAGNESIRIDYTTQYRTFPVWYSPNSKSVVSRRSYKELVNAVYFDIKNDVSINQFIDDYKNNECGFIRPETITSVKRGDFFTVLAYNKMESTHD
tara:strand:- start:22 stop:1857 length:1836 start_codon:yes stop_codon:yes gene_type:complete